MYRVSIVREGKNGSIDVKGRLWENGTGYPVCECIWEGRRKADAVAAADAAPMRATVHRNWAAHVEYDNGKAPGRRERPFDVPMPV